MPFFGWLSFGFLTITVGRFELIIADVGWDGSSGEMIRICMGSAKLGPCAYNAGNFFDGLCANARGKVANGVAGTLTRLNSG